MLAFDLNIKLRCLNKNNQHSLGRLFFNSRIYSNQRDCLSIFTGFLLLIFASKIFISFCEFLTTRICICSKERDSFRRLDFSTGFTISRKLFWSSHNRNKLFKIFENHQRLRCWRKRNSRVLQSIRERYRLGAYYESKQRTFRLRRVVIDQCCV